MFPIDYLLALALLTAPVDSPEPTVSLEDFSCLQPTLEKMALDLEIMDLREVGWLLTLHKNLGSDLRLIRRRYAEHNDAPFLRDCMRFPDRTAIGDLLSFNRSYRQHLENCLAIETVRWWDLHETLQETDRLYHVWNTVREASCTDYYITSRRHALKRLRELLGEEAYYAGCLPPHVPVWRFQRID